MFVACVFLNLEHGIIDYKSRWSKLDCHSFHNWAKANSPFDGTVHFYVQDDEITRNCFRNFWLVKFYHLSWRSFNSISLKKLFILQVCWQLGIVHLSGDFRMNTTRQHVRSIAMKCTHQTVAEITMEIHRCLSICAICQKKIAESPAIKVDLFPI